MTGDPTRDREASGHPFGMPEDKDMDPNEYRDHQRREREAEQKARMDAAHEKAKAEREQCANSTRVDGPWHTWRFDGDDPYVICVFCGKRQDALTGEVVTP